MSDEIPDLDELPDALEGDSYSDSVLGTNRQVKESERLAKSLGLDARRVESNDIEDELASEHARQVLQDDLEKLYCNDLDINNPPDSIEAFEKRVTLRNLSRVAIEYGTPTDVAFEPREIVFDVGDDEEHEGVDSLSDAVISFSEPVGEHQAKKAIDKMAEYGTVAEQFLAIVAGDNKIHPQIAEYALDAIGDAKEERTEQQSLIDALRQWWGGE